MQATIYVTNEAYQAAQSIKDLDYYDRMNLCDEISDLAERPGYHFKNANKLKLAPLPDAANIIRPDTLEVSMPANLRGCIFEMAPNLPLGYADIVGYWSGGTVNTNTSGGVYFQCPLNEYMVDLGHNACDAPIVNDRLLSEGVVVAISGLAKILTNLTPEDFIEIRVPIDQNMLSVEGCSFNSGSQYKATNGCYELVFLKVADILASPDTDRVYIDLLRHELLDYGYWY